MKHCKKLIKETLKILEDIDKKHESKKLTNLQHNIMSEDALKRLVKCKF